MLDIGHSRFKGLKWTDIFRAIRGVTNRMTLDAAWGNGFQLASHDLAKLFRPRDHRQRFSAGDSQRLHDALRIRILHA